MIVTKTLSQTAELGNSKPLVWINVTNPSQDEINQLLQKYKMPKDFITGGLDGYEVPRSEIYRNESGQELKLFIFLYPYKLKEKNLMNLYKASPISFIMVEETIITVSLNNFTLLEDLDKDICLTKENMKDSYHFLLILFWHISKRYIDFLTLIDQNIHKLEKKAVKSTDNHIFYELIGLNKGLVYFETAIKGNREILSSIQQLLKDHPHFGDLNHLLRDVQVEQHQAQIMIYESKSLIDKLSTMFSNVINNNLNNIMKVLTSWTILLTIPTIVGGLWGMNVSLPLEKSPHAFTLLVTGCMVLISVIYIYLKKNKML